MSDFLLFEQSGPIATLTINRPETRNALGLDGDGEAFETAIGRIQADRAVRCVILTGAGSAFSAGGDLKAMQDKSGPFGGPGVILRETYRNNIQRLIRALWNLDVPMVAAVNGPAIGLGNDVACLADMRVAADTARFGATFLKIGLVPGDGGAWLLPRTIGMARAAELFYTGKLISAEEALSWGLVNKVVPGDALMAEARAMAEEVAAQPPDVLRMTKRLIREGQRTTFETVLEMSAAYQAIVHHTEDHSEAVSAFFEKRKGDFKGR